MKKYNKSEIMKKAWELFRMAKNWVDSKSFSWALTKAWAMAKEAACVSEKLEKECMNVVNGCKLYMRKSIIACAGLVGWVITGQTFGARKEIKRAGFRFDGESKNWYTENRTVAENFFGV